MPQCVLVVDDSQDIHDLVRVRLRPEAVTLLHAYDAEAGIAMARENRVDLVLLDLSLGASSGLDVCGDLKSDSRTRDVPIIFLTGTVDVEMKVRAFDLGAVDYVVKPFDPVELRARVRAALRTKRYLDLLATKAQLDGLTGLFNRSYFDSRLRDELAHSRRTGRALGVAMADIDHFKNLNDTYGHPFGDEVLRLVADALTRIVRESDVVCRYGGEEFGVVLRETNREEAIRAGVRIRESIATLNLVHRDARVPLSISVGVASTELFANLYDHAAEDLVQRADRALYEAKRAGRDRVVAATHE